MINVGWCVVIRFKRSGAGHGWRICFGGGRVDLRVWHEMIDFGITFSLSSDVGSWRVHRKLGFGEFVCLIPQAGSSLPNWELEELPRYSVSTSCHSRSKCLSFLIRN